MVCQGTKFYVLKELERLGFKYYTFELGEIDFEEDLSLTEIKKLDQSLLKYGLELRFRNSKLVSEIRHIIFDLVENNITPGTNFPKYITQKVGYNYAYLNMYFTIETGLSIEKYYTEKKNEKVSQNKPARIDMFNSVEKSA